MNPEKPYFCRSSNGDKETECFVTADEAITTAESLKLAPFIVMQLIAQPIGHRLTNGRAAFDERVDRGMLGHSG